MADEQKRIAVIMAGGVGERFWPLSRKTRPKQLLPLGQGGSTLLEDTLDRIAPVIPSALTYVVTGRPLLETIRHSGLPIPAENIFAEPAKRNTAGALVFASAYLLAMLGDEALDATLVVLPADHKIEPADSFQNDVRKALEAVEELGGLAVMGIPPTRPETGYGYVEVYERAGEETESDGVMPVAAFREKPDAETAAEYSASGRHFWNSGMFFWKLSDFLLELEKASPEHFSIAGELVEYLIEQDMTAAQDAFEQLEDISIDYALMEKAEKVWMVTATFSWDDLGAWDSLIRVLDTDEEGNLALGESIRLDTRNSIVLNDAGDRSSVAIVGVEGLTVVVTDDALLVIPTDRSQEVREVVRRLKESGSPHL